MNSNPIYLSAGVNQTKKCLDWNCDINLIAYAAANRIILYDPLNFYVVGISKENHGSFINCIQWIVTKSKEKYLLTTSTDGSAKFWVYESCSFNGCISPSPKEFACIKGHSGSVACGYGISLPSLENVEEEDLFVVTTGDDFCIKGWKISINDGSIEELFTYKLPGRALVLDILIIPSDESKKDQHWPLIVYGGDDGNTYIMSSADDNDILLSSGSKDGLIRLWRISHTNKHILPKDNDLLHTKALEIQIPKLIPNDNGENGLHLFCNLESVMQGHEGLLSHLDWHSSGNSLWLLSCAKTEDRSIVVWEAQEDSSSINKEKIWVEKTRLGEVGGNREGFFNCKADSIYGIMRMDLGFLSQLLVDTSTKWLILAGTEQEGQVDIDKWQEIARPQVHGLDMSCVTSLSPVTFVSGSEEKLLRGFTATKTFLKRLQNLCPDGNLVDIVPSLGLSNKADNVENNDEEVPSPVVEVEPQFNTNIVENLPTENELMLGTVWSEVSKLYGHGNEILAVASSPDGTLLASSCKAAAPEDAKVIIWETKEWKEIQSLSYHRLTVTQIEFSSCGRYLLTVSRDRTWAVFHRTSDQDFIVKFHSGNLSKGLNHSRIIWSCCWVPDSLSFITGSRDKTIAIWRPVYDSDGGTLLSWERAIVFHEDEEIVAVAVEKSYLGDENIVIAIGCVDGSIRLKLFNTFKNQIIDEKIIEICHRKSIRRLRFQPKRIENVTNGHINNGCVNKNLILSSCGNDNFIILHQIQL
ncbi:putative elongator complex protein 2 [Armadillidium vulgare]|nr:putative elongator complex protein 2 [Armadillidium vulgare]